MTTLLLDPDIRDWVVLPLFVMIVFAGLLRQIVARYMQGAKQPIPVIAQRANGVAKQCHALRTAAAHSISTVSWMAHRDAAVELLKEEAEWLESDENSGEAEDPMEKMMANPMEMLGGNMVFMVQNMVRWKKTYQAFSNKFVRASPVVGLRHHAPRNGYHFLFNKVMMQGIQHFFSGFILLKVPFPLTVGFKNMFQRGVAPMPDLEPAYVSSVSWYFLVLYGLRSFFKLITGTPPLEQREQDMLLTRLGYQNPPNPAANKQNPEALAKHLRSEADNLELHQVKSELDGAEKRLLGKRYPKRKVKSKGNADFLLGKKKTSKKKE